MQQSVLSMVILTFDYCVEIHETILLTFTLFSTSLYRWNPSLINLLYKRDQGIPLMARLTWICRSYSQQPKSTTHGRHIWSSKYVTYDSCFVNFFLVSRSFQFRVRKENGGARRIWTKCKYHDVRKIISIPNWYFSFLKFLRKQYMQVQKKWDHKGYKSGHVPTRVHLLSLLFEGSFSFLEHWLFRTL